MPNVEKLDNWEPVRSTSRSRLRRCALGVVLTGVAAIALLGVVTFMRGLVFNGLPELWQVPEFALTDQRGVTQSRDTLRGKPFIADFIFTQCTNVCPMITSRMVQIQRRLADADVRFVSFSVDPTHDDVAALAQYAQRWNPRESRWTLLANDSQTLARLSAGFQVPLPAAVSGSEASTASAPMHTSLMFLVDADSVVRGIYASDDPANIDRLVADTGSLTRAQLPTRPESAHAASSYAGLDCAGCHEDPKVAPPLTDLHGAQRLLQDGRHVTVDAAYLRRAILDPEQELVQGYLPLMRSYRNELTDTGVDALVRELLERHGAGSPVARSDDAGTATDPVCGMQVRVTPTTPNVVSGGHKVYFCSEACRDTFNAEHNHSTGL
jgi:protein SCO1/2